MDFVVDFDTYKYLDFDKHKLRNTYLHMDLIVNIDTECYCLGVSKCDSLGVSFKY